MTLDQLLDQWENDSKIHPTDLDGSSIDTAKLHSKYLRLLAEAKVKLSAAKNKQKVLLKQKWLWYNGKMSREQMDQLGWEYDPLDGIHVLKTEMGHYYDADPDIQNSESRIQYYKTMVETLTDILDTIKWRHQTIRNIITWRQFQSGN